LLYLPIAILFHRTEDKKEQDISHGNPWKNPFNKKKYYPIIFLKQTPLQKNRNPFKNAF